MSDHYDSSAELRIFRRKFGLAIADVAELLDVDARTINRWESGAAAPLAAALEALRALDKRMQHRLIERIATLKTAGITARIPYYRDRVELEAAGSFYLDLPSAFYEWEVAQLVDRVGIQPTYTQEWREAHPYRAPYRPVAPTLAVTDRGNFTLRDDPRLPRELVELLTFVLPAYGGASDNTIAYAWRVPLGHLVDLCDALRDGGCHVDITQPWEHGPRLDAIMSHRTDAQARVDLYLIDQPDSLELELVSLTTTTRPTSTWATTPKERLPWL